MYESTFYDDHVGAMMIVDSSDTKGTTAKQLLAEVRTFFECRFARWIDSDTIAYVGKDHHGYTYTISKGQSTKIFDYPYGTFGAIPNRQLTHAIDGFNRVFAITGSSLTMKQDYDGCEGNMSNDGKWAYRVKASSHHFTRMDLSSLVEEVFFNNHDSALPSSQGYIYFPQISACQRYLAFGASPDQHNHFESDYDIFVVPIDPKSFKKSGNAVKYSFSNTLDSYPDIWIAPDTPQLTTIEVTAGTRIIQPNDKLQVKATLTDQQGTPFAAVVSWSVSGGGSIAPPSSGSAVTEHTAVFSSDGTPGTFDVTASSGGVKGTLTIDVVDLTFPLQINCGSNDHDVSGWTRDDAFVSGGGDWVNSNTVDTSGVQGAAPAEIYRSVRHLSPHSYDFSLPDGTYVLKIHFADAFDLGRSMTYTVEGKEVLTGFDVTSKAGGVNRAWVESFDVTVSDGNGLQIEATSPTGDVFEAGLEIDAVKIEPPPPVSDAGTGGDGPLSDAGLEPESDAETGHGLDDDADLTGGCALELELGSGRGSVLLLLLALAAGLWFLARRSRRTR
jgi:hypothetical protein